MIAFGAANLEELMKLHFLTLIIVLAAGVEASAQQTNVCAATTTVRATAPADPSADPVQGNWYLNEDRSIWVSVPQDGWPAGGQVYRGSQVIKGQKTYWVRPRGMLLQISGRRLDANAPPVEADIPCCYTTGFQIVALHFPTEGCWEVHATAGERELHFVTKVLPPIRPRAQ
jgi:hypothetical protein